MKIAFDHQIFGWQEYGGISRYAFELASALHFDCAEEVAVFCPLYVNRYLEHAPAGLLRGCRRVPSFPRSGRIYRALNRWLAGPAMRRFRPDIVHETYYSASGAKLTGARHVLTVHDMIHERFPEGFSSADPTRREKARAVARADHVICVSENTRRTGCARHWRHDPKSGLYPLRESTWQAMTRMKKFRLKFSWMTSTAF